VTVCVVVIFRPRPCRAVLAEETQLLYHRTVGANTHRPSTTKTAFHNSGFFGSSCIECAPHRSCQRLIRPLPHPFKHKQFYPSPVRQPTMPSQTDSTKFVHNVPQFEHSPLMPKTANSRIEHGDTRCYSRRQAEGESDGGINRHNCWRRHITAIQSRSFTISGNGGQLFSSPTT